MSLILHNAQLPLEMPSGDRSRLAVTDSVGARCLPETPGHLRAEHVILAAEGTIAAVPQPYGGFVWGVERLCYC